MYDIRDVFLRLAEDMSQNRSFYQNSNKLVFRELQNERKEIFFLAIEPHKEKRMLIIPIIPKMGHVDLKRFPICRGSALNRERFDKIGSLENLSCLIIRQTVSENNIFETFTSNLCERLWSCSSAEIVPMLQKTMQKWQHFFSKAAEAGLSAEQRRGLYGELYVLHHLLNQGCHPNIVSQWQGPLREDLDFLFEHIGLEVKTTLTHQPLKVTISNEHQLSTEATSRLFLAVLPIRVTKHSGDTLPELISTLRNQFRDWPLCSELLDDLLLQAGYHDAHAEVYQEERYTVLERKYFQVEEGFPRIAPSSLLPGVTHVRYEIILDGCVHYQVAEPSIIHAIQEL